MTTKHNLTPEERDERVTLPLPPEKAIEAILATGPQAGEDLTEQTNQAGDH